MALGRKLRNRILGLLVLVSIAMILVPAIMDPGQIYKKSSDSIAVNGKGALTSQDGHMLQGQQDYSDLLAPVEGSDVTPEQLAAQNAGSRENEVAEPLKDDSSLAIANDNADPFANVNNAAMPIPEPTPAPIPADGTSQVQRLKQAQAQNNQTAPVASPKNTPQKEVLKSSKPKQQTTTNAASNTASSERLVSSHTKPTTSQTTKETSSSSGAYAVQVGVFSSKQNADAVVAKLKNAGVAARQVPATINGRSLIRVYAGSAKTREAASGIARRVEQIIGTKPSIVNP